MGAAGAPTSDPLFTLREYRKLAPWRLRDLATVTGAMLEASGIRPVNAAAASRPNERTIRFYVARTLVTPPEGRGTASIYTYRHLLQVLFIKLRQMEGATLETIHEELKSTTGDVLERRVASSVGAALPSPGQLPFLTNDEQPRGRAGQLLQGSGSAVSAIDPSSLRVSVTSRRVSLSWLLSCLHSFLTSKKARSS